MLSKVPGTALGRIRSRAGASSLVMTLALLLVAPKGSAAPLPAPANLAEPITDPAQIFGLSSESKSVAHPLRIEGRVSYFDPNPAWKLLWIEANNSHVGTYMLLAPKAPVMRAGQRVAIEGTLVPDQGLAASSVTVKVLQDYEPIEPIDSKGRIADLQAFNSRMIKAEGYVDGQQYIDEDHVRLALILDDRPVIGWVKPDDPHAIPDWEGKFVRVNALYSARFDPTSTASSIELWVGEQKNLTVVGSLADSSRFKLPRTSVSDIYQTPVGTDILVRGRVEAHEAGSFIVIRDNTGQVVARSIQQQRIPFGTEVEAVGRVALAGSRWVLDSALFRRVSAVDQRIQHLATGVDALENVDQIRQLSLEEAARGRPVKISGLVTWSLPGNDFFFLQDLSGGIRVRYDPAKIQTPSLGKYLQIEGVTFDGGFVPAVELRRIARDLGSMSPPDAKPVTFEQAVTGKENGQWVEMRGFIQFTDSDGDSRSIHVTTPGGEFVGRLQSPVNFSANTGSLIRVRGVCEATADQNGRLSQVILRVPFLHSITLEEGAPTDYYDLPLRSVKSLRQLSGVRDMTRVRVSGIVLHAIPGNSVYLQDGDTGVQLLTRETNALVPGDTVEAVGILGWEGVRIVLREVVYRKIRSGPPPAPVSVAEPALLMPTLDARLVMLRGTLIDASRQRDRTRPTLQSGNTLFEAMLNYDGTKLAIDPPLGAGLELTGIYRLWFDDSRHSRGFTLQLRSPSDVVVYQHPRLWTLQRALAVSALLGGITLLGLGWITALRRRVHKQTRQIREQLERQARLEAEVQRAARLESLGVLAGGIAHDFNNLLTVIIGNLGLAMLDEKLSAATIHCLTEIERGAARARGLTRQLLTFAKGGNPLRATVPLGELVKSATDRALHGSTVLCDYTVAADLWSANVDKDQISQAIQNIVLNAVQAMPNGGTLQVSLTNDEVAPNAKPPLAPGRYVKLAIRDSGEGIKPEILPRIFDPYFSTRKTGSGLGLATVYSIIKKHEGRIDVESSPDCGTSFFLWLPAAGEVAPAVSAPPASVSTLTPSSAATKNTRVLFMDDEESIREIVAVVLRRMGLEVTLVADGGAAMREFSLAQHGKHAFGLVILDLTIPGGMGGREAMELIRKLDPNVPAIVSSGYSNDPVMANFASYGFQAMVQKPYEIGQLVATVNQLLGRTKITGSP